MATQLYQDLCREIDIMEIRINDLEREYEFWYKACHGIGRSQIPLDVCLERMKEICDQVEMYSMILEEKEKARRDIESQLEQLEGIESKIAYMRDIQGKTLLEISIDLGYSYDWVKKLSARTTRAKRKGTKKALTG